MSIRTKQIGRLANTVITQFLQNGSLPTVRSVIAGVYDALRGHLAGTPLADFTPAISDHLTDPVAQSEHTAAVSGDVTDLFAENIDLVNRIVRDFDYKQTYRERLAQRIIDVAAELQQATLQQTYQNKGTIGSFADIDFANTTALVNFRDYTVELPPSSNRSQRIDLSTARLSYEASAAQPPVGAIEDILSDTLNTAFFIRTTAQTPNSKLLVKAAFPRPVTFSKVLLTAHIGSTTQVKLMLDGEQFATSTIDVTRRVSWEFAPRPVSLLTLEFTKAHPDGSEGGAYTFDFGIKNLTVLLEEYEQQATFQSAPISFNNLPLGTLTLAADQIIPPNCGIAWSLSTDGGRSFAPCQLNAPLTFATKQLINSKRVFGVRSVRDSARVFAKTQDLTGQAVDAGLAVMAAIRGGRTPLFALCNVSPSITFGNSQVWRGRNAWKVKAYHYDVTDGPTIQDPPPTIDDWISLRGSSPVVYSRYQPTEFASEQLNGLDADALSAIHLPAIEYPFNGINDRVMHLFEATLVVDRTLAPSVLAQLNALTVNLPALFASQKAALYLNGVRVSVISTNVAGSQQCTAVLGLQPGPNLLQIVTNSYASLGGAAFDIGTSTFTTWCAYGAGVQWYADAGPLTEVSLFELQFQTARNDFSRYALVNSLSSANQLLVVRELPTTQYEVQTYGVNDPSAPTSCILRAQLSGSAVQPALTPKINSYQLTMSY